MSPAAHDLLNQAPAGLLAFQDDGIVVAANRTLLDVLGLARGDVVGRHVEGLLGVAARIFYQTHLFPLVRMHGRADEIYMELRSGGGARVPVLLNARRVDSADGPLTYCAVVQVQERKKYEDALLRARREAEEAHARERAAHEAKSHYLRSVSHEIRTPINALLGYADLLDLGAGQPMGDRQQGYVERVRQAARHLLRLVNDVLDLAKIESGAMTVADEPAELDAAAEASLALVRPQAAEKELELVTPRDAPAGHYLGSHERVVQILVNLLSNAVKFTEPGGRVHLRWAAVPVAASEARLDGAGPWLEVQVEDTGIGIPADRLEDLFLPFHQVADAGQAPAQGTGLGLAISRELARLMGGDITVRSTPGAGSTFSLWLRAAPGAVKGDAA